MSEVSLCVSEGPTENKVPGGMDEAAQCFIPQSPAHTLLTLQLSLHPRLILSGQAK